jgi:hypothetical protein
MNLPVRIKEKGICYSILRRGGGTSLAVIRTQSTRK